ncbi:hypothetical protein ABL78_5183 [Leptomonas seymouri]|uniref:Uncharacterized protein n=1 Tax=Leptomonas seymouri TaxID=5684 RepID=A0A0N1HVJ7_LEPSE|nr:hypothetical protein ABL78_5183 [Leptomonas seymouri]|eukprot:KPI85765.1 hypothetical protein ABL78_5183 [Leptomonas seymouri]
MKKLRFDDMVTTASSASEMSAGGGLSGVASGRSALKCNPSTNSPSPLASSLRRPSEGASSHSDMHVQLNPKLEVIQHDGNTTSLAAIHLLPAKGEPAGEVANFLANVGAGMYANSGNCSNNASSNSASSPYAPTASGSLFNVPSATMVGDNGSCISESTSRSVVPDASERFRTLLLQLSALVLDHRPKDPEQCILDHLNARLLSSSAISRAPCSDSDAGEESKEDGDASLAAAHDNSSAEWNPQHPLSAAETAPVFQPIGDTVAERLASNALSTEVGHSLLLHLAELLINTQPDDPENFLWARLEARSFSEEAAHVAMNTDGCPVVRPEDPTELALLKDIPVSSPGYVVAANLMLVLFAKKPADPLSYLFYHIGSRARSSAAQSAHSPTRHLRAIIDENGILEESCTSREFNEDSSSGAEDAVESGSVNDSANQLPLQRKGSLGSLFDATASAVAASSMNASAGQSLRRLAADRTLCTRHRQLRSLANSRGSSARRSTSAAGPLRALRDPSCPSSMPDELSALNSSTAKRVSIAQQVVQESLPSQFSYDSSALPGNTAGGNITGAAGLARANRDPTVTTEPQPHAGPQPSPGPAPTPAANGALWKMEADEHARIRQEFDLLYLREELRLERLQHEVRTLTRECEYRTRMALLNKTDRMADRAAAAAREALEEAQSYRGFLCAQMDLLNDEKQRQIRMISQHVARTALRQAEQQSACGSSSSYGVPSELDILKKQVELLSMEQARAKHYGCGSAPYSAYACGSPNK